MSHKFRLAMSRYDVFRKKPESFAMTSGQYFALVNTQALMALKADASRYYLGYIWWILEPLLYVAVFYLVFGVVLDSDINNFLVFLVCGKLPFVWFSQTVNKASESLLFASSLIGKINVPKSLFPMAIVQEGLYRQAAVFLLLFLVLFLFGYWPDWAWLWLVPVLAVHYIMIVACSLIAAFIVCQVRDFSRIIGLGMIFLMLTSGIFWDPREITDPSKLDLFFWINPIAFIIDAYREVLMHNRSPNLAHLLVIGAVFGVILATIGAMYRRYSQYIALKVLTA